MPKSNVSDWDITPANNSDVGGVSILGTAAVSNFDDALRTVMSQIAATPLHQTADTMLTNLGGGAAGIAAFKSAATILVDGVVTEAKIGTGAVTTAKLGAEAVTEAKIAASAVSDFRFVDPNGPRIPVSYYSDYAVQITGVNSVAMGGFRVDGHYTEGRAPVFELPAFTTPARHIIDLGNADGTLISTATGTIIGNMTASAGQAAAFDGSTAQAYAASAVGSTTDGKGYIGKDFSASPKIIARVRAYPTTDFGFDSTVGTTTITLTLRGKNGSAPASASDGTSLGTWSGSDILESRAVITDNRTAWDYVWLQMENDTGTNRVCLAQLEINEYDPQAGDLFAETEHVKDNWYAQFAAANDGDATATLGSMPWFRVSSIAGNVITLNIGGENDRSLSTKTYYMATNELVGASVLIRTETVDSRVNAISNRIATVTANTATTITLDDVGSMAAYDYFLVAPVQKGVGPYDRFCYLNTCMIDSGSVRNIADSGSLVSSRGVENTQASISGAGVGVTKVPFDGLVPPLATCVVFYHSETFTGATLGFGTIRYGLDSSHDTHQFNYKRSDTTAGTYAFMLPAIPFSRYFGQSLWFFYSNTLNIADNTRAINIRGWVEP